jgi:hypothetical protein
MTVTDYDPQQPGTLSSMLWSYVDVYWNEYQEYWELIGQTEGSSLTEDQREMHRGFGRIGDAVRRTILPLSPDADSVATVNQFLKAIGIELDADSAQVATVLRTLHKQPIARDCLAISRNLSTTLRPSPRSFRPRNVAPLN